MTEVYLDIPRLYTAIAEWLGCMIFLLIVKRRISDTQFMAASAVFLVVQSILLVVTKGTESNILWLLYMAAVRTVTCCMALRWR